MKGNFSFLQTRLTDLLPISRFANHKTKIISHISRMSLILVFFQLLAFSAHAQVDTLICDNGGFEDDFQYYEGERTTYFNGSDSCSLVDAANNPVVWEDVLTLPSAKEFEIVTTGIDPLVGFDMVKFGNKALKLNNQYGHTLPNGYSCAGSRGVNKLTKRFKVTEENRDFTIWYSAILENPACKYSM